MVGLQSQQQTKTFVVCQIWKFIALFVNTSRSVDKPHEARSGRATYLKAESSKIRMNPFREVVLPDLASLLIIITIMIMKPVQVELSTERESHPKLGPLTLDL